MKGAPPDGPPDLQPPRGRRDHDPNGTAPTDRRRCGRRRARRGAGRRGRAAHPELHPLERRAAVRGLGERLERHPGGNPLPTWRFTDSAGADRLPLVVTQGDTVRIRLHNTLSLPVSLAMPQMEGVLHGPSGSATARGADKAGAAAGGDRDYTFTASRPGTFLYEAGPTPAGKQQVAMGLAGAIVVLPSTPGQAYGSAATAYDDEAVMVLTEVDPALNGAADPAAFNLRNLTPRYWLVNGKPTADELVVAGGAKLLLRYVNGGVQEPGGSARAAPAAHRRKRPAAREPAHRRRPGAVRRRRRPGRRLGGDAGDAPGRRGEGGLPLSRVRRGAHAERLDRRHAGLRRGGRHPVTAVVPARHGRHDPADRRRADDTAEGPHREPREPERRDDRLHRHRTCGRVPRRRRRRGTRYRCPVRDRHAARRRCPDGAGRQQRRVHDHR